MKTCFEVVCLGKFIFFFIKVSNKKLSTDLRLVKEIILSFLFHSLFIPNLLFAGCILKSKMSS